MSKVVVEPPDSLRKHAELPARGDDITVDQFFATAVAEKIAALEALDYIARRSSQANEAAFLEVLDKVPPGEPEDDWDRLPGP